MTRVAPPVLGEFELLVVLAVLRLGDAAYPLAIANDIEKTTHRKAARPAVLITLNRLEEKGLVTSRYGDPAQERGGRPRRLFLAKPIAVQAVKAALGRIEALTRDLKNVLES
jgi:DNA-binding PadR family transcriptional regulator